MLAAQQRATARRHAVGDVVASRHSKEPRRSNVLQMASPLAEATSWCASSWACGLLRARAQPAGAAQGQWGADDDHDTRRGRQCGGGGAVAGRGNGP